MTNKNNFVIIESLGDIDKTSIAKKLQETGLSFINNNNSLTLKLSELSAYAYDYAVNKKMPPVKKLSSIAKLIKTKKVLLVYLSLPTINSSLIQHPGKTLNQENQNIITDQTILNLYKHWYQDILPHNFGITPLIINLDNIKKLKSHELVKDISACLKADRVAQINVVVCRYNNNKLEVLILKRTKSRGDFWQTITGGVRIGESLVNTAIREIEEKLSLSVSRIKYTNFSYHFMGNDHYVLHEYVYTTLIDLKDSQKIKISQEHDEYQWVNEKTAIAYLKFEDNKKAIKKAIKTIKATM